MFQKIINLIPDGYSSISSQFAYLVKKELIAVNTVNVRQQPGTTTKTLYQVSKGELVGATTGRIYKAKGGSTVWIEINDANNTTGWVSGMLVEVKDEDAQAVLETIINYDRATYNNLVIAAGLLAKAEKQGIKVDSQKAKVQAIFTGLQKRQDELASQSWAKITYSAISSSLISFVERIAEKTGLGLVITLSALAITAIKVIVVASISVAITVAVIRYLQTNRDESVQQFDESKKAVSEILNKLSPEDKETLVTEINEQLEDAYKQGKYTQFWKSYGSFFKAGAFVLLGGLLVIKGIPYIQKQMQNNQNSQNNNQPQYNPNGRF